MTLPGRGGQIRRSPPRPVLAGHDLDAIGQENPGLFRILKNLETTIKAQGAQQAVLNSGSDVTPKGPRAVTASQLGGTIQLTINHETSLSRITHYQIWRASAGTVSSPTTPSFDIANRYAIVPIQRADLVSPLNVTTWADRDFSVQELDPADGALFSYWVSSLDDSNRESIGILASGSPIQVVGTSAGDSNGETAFVVGNMLFNPQFRGKASAGTLPLDATLSVLSVANTTPITVQTNVAHGLNNESVVIAFYTAGGGGVYQINGYYDIIVTGVDTFTLTGTVASGASGADAGGFVFNAFNNKKTPYYDSPPNPANDVLGFGTCPDYLPWIKSVGTSNWVADGTRPTGEIELTAPTAGNHVQVTTAIRSTKVPPGTNARLVLSVYARCATQPTNSLFGVGFNLTKGFHTLMDNSVTWSTALLTTSYQRFAFAFTPGTALTTVGKYLTLGFYNQNVSGTGQSIFITRPMLNIGSFPGAFTVIPDGADRPGAMSANAEPTTSLLRAPSTLIKRNYVYP